MEQRAPRDLPPTQRVVPPNGKSSTFVVLQGSNHGGEPNWKCRTPAPAFTALEIRSGSDWITLSFGARTLTWLCSDPLDTIFVNVSAPESPVAPRPASTFDAKIVAPLTAHPGDHMRYLVQLTNVTSASVRLGECPAYVQNIAGPQELGSADRPGFTYVEYRQILNCAGIREISPGVTVTFEMYFDIPANVLAGSYVLPWRLDGPTYSTGAKVSLGILP